MSLIAGDLGDHSESEDEEEGEAEKTRWDEIFFFIVLSFYIFLLVFFLSFLFQVEGGAGRGEEGEDGAGHDPPGQPRPPPGLALGLVRLRLLGGQQCGPGQELVVVKWVRNGA